MTIIFSGFPTAITFKVFIHHLLLLPLCNIAQFLTMPLIPGWLAVPDSRLLPQLEHRVHYRGAHIAHDYAMLTHSESNSSGTQNAGEWAPPIKLELSWGVFFMATCWDSRMFLGGWRRMSFDREVEPWLLGNEVCECLCANVCVYVCVCAC